MLNQAVHMGLLFDFYGQLLTDKQRLFFSLYHQDDLSLGEIAEQYGVTRQAVYDTLRRSQNTLLDLEEKLGLVKRSGKQRVLVEKIQTKLADLDEMLSHEAISGSWQEQLTEIDDLVAQLIEDI